MSGYRTGSTALIVAVPQAEPAVGHWRIRYDESALYGVPPHVTVLYPFLLVGEIDEPALAEAAAGVARFEVEFASCARFPGDVLYLEPSLADPFRQLTGAVATRWPRARAYGGTFDDPVPHLTVAHTADPGFLGTIEADVGRRLPVTAEVTELLLVVFDGTRWRPHRAFPLAGADPQ